MKNIFVAGLNDANRKKLEGLPGAGQLAFHSLLHPEQLDAPDSYSVEQLMDQARSELSAFTGSVDAVVGYIDIPIGMMLPILCRELGLRSPTPESVARCQHKYWSRLEQVKVVSEHVPEFRVFDPFDDRALDVIDLPFPFWVKPVKSAGSHLGFRITDRQGFCEAMRIIRRDIDRLAEPYNYLLSQLRLPPEVAWVDARYCLAEQIIGGRQCTLEGYVQKGRVHVYGAIDSIRHRNRTTFLRYEYPSALPLAVVSRMEQVTRQFIHHVGLDDSPFNVEFFWEPKADRIWLLEVNTRISQSHCDLFEKVDGVSHHQVMVDVALGRPIDFPRRQGAFRRAAKFYLRHYSDGVVARVPDGADFDAVAKAVPGTIVLPQVELGTRLSDVPEQDSYSYALAYVFMGAENRSQLLSNYRKCVQRLGFRVDPALPSPRLTAARRASPQARSIVAGAPSAQTSSRSISSLYTLEYTRRLPS